MVVTMLCTFALLAALWYSHVRQSVHREADREWVLQQLQASDGIAEGRLIRMRAWIMERIEADNRVLRGDITDLWAMQSEGASQLDQCGRLRHEAVLQRLQDYYSEVGQRLDRLQDAALEAGSTWREGIDRQLTDVMTEVSDPTILRLMQAIALAFQVDTLDKLTDGAGVMESRGAGSVEGPLAPHPVPNIGRKLEPARFSEETISAGMQELIDGASARGINLSMADARQQAMLMLNDVEV